MELTTLVSGHGRVFRYAAWFVLLATLMHLFWLQWRPGSEFRRLWSAGEQTDARMLASRHEQIARIADQTGAGNLFLRIDPAVKANPLSEPSLTYLYYRSVYALYPRRIYIAPADTVVNNGADIRRIDFNPDIQWLQTRDVRFILVFEIGDAGRNILRLDPVLSGDGQPGPVSGADGED